MGFLKMVLPATQAFLASSRKIKAEFSIEPGDFKD